LEVRIELTRHFWTRWERRKKEMLKNGINPETIKEFALNPDFVIDDPKHEGREWRIKRVGGRCLRIVVESKGDRLEVVTAFFDRTLRRKGLCG